MKNIVYILFLLTNFTFGQTNKLTVPEIEKYAKSIDGQWMKDGVPVPQKTIDKEYQQLVKKYLPGDKNKGYSGVGPYINRVLGR